MAKQLNLPVILVADASAMARSVAAMILGYRFFDRKTDVIGVILNRVGGKGHLCCLNEALSALPGLELFGGIPLEDRVKIPERHLGLIVAEENVIDGWLIHRLARLVENHLDLDRMLKMTRVTVRSLPSEDQNEQAPKKYVPIAIAQDRAFCFYYPDNLELLGAAGATLKTFSPIVDPDLPPGTKGIYLGGGYPELYASELACNRPMQAAIRKFIEAGGPVYAECGGFMYLTKALIDGKKQQYSMVGVYPFKSKMLPRLKALGYREIVSVKRTFIARGQRVRGHEFHYSELQDTLTGKKIARTYSIQEASKATLREGYRYKNCLGSYVHLHFGSNPALPKGFIDACRSFSDSEP
jgi:cobyrinic acid a,c-diamide synthase